LACCSPNAIAACSRIPPPLSARSQDCGSAATRREIFLAPIKNQIEIAAERLELDAAGAEAEAARRAWRCEVLLGERNRARKLSSLTRSIHWELFRRSDTAPPATFSRPDLVAAEAARVKAEADFAPAKGGAHSGSNAPRSIRAEPPDQPNTLGFGVSFPLPLWNRNGGNIVPPRHTRTNRRQAEKVRAQSRGRHCRCARVLRGSVDTLARYRDELTPKSRQIRESVALASRKAARRCSICSPRTQRQRGSPRTAQAGRTPRTRRRICAPRLNLTDSTKRTQNENEI